MGVENYVKSLEAQKKKALHVIKMAERSLSRIEEKLSDAEAEFKKEMKQGSARAKKAAGLEVKKSPKVILIKADAEETFKNEKEFDDYYEPVGGEAPEEKKEKSSNWFF
jgi:hypothetical protein